MNYTKKISNAIISRLPRYYMCLGELNESGTIKTSSKEISEKTNIPAGQLRQDLNNFGGFGLQGYGYDVKFLYNKIKKIIGLNKTYNLIIIGGGNIGQALANYADFEAYGIYIRAIFDINPKLIGIQVRGINIYDTDYLGEYIQKNPVDIAVLTLPANKAKHTADRIISYGVKGIWNFSHIDISVPNNVMVENVNLTDGIMALIYKINQTDKVQDMYI
ncbi:Redox-sensing transcriptional repressor Rex [bioreactor metagenome]|uniref:Redox-sensing transcriptional repressor Rex n=1 Tax=bioreactor metagenome TaxID=1076179 RepID=A0A645DQ77_9ZZZZ|nr:redox-sensing transcriptional repressor Rex [Candidatus Metalachnospira sp.]